MRSSFLKKNSTWVIKSEAQSSLIPRGRSIRKSFNRSRMISLISSNRDIESFLFLLDRLTAECISSAFKKKPHLIPQKQAIAAAGQITLMNFYEKAFSRKKLKVAQLLLTRDDLANRKRYLNARHAIHELLNFGLVPIINENDTVAVDEIK